MEFVELNNGYKMPVIGLGLGGFGWTNNFKVDEKEVIGKALEIGYRHFDTAYVYRNEKALGSVLKEWTNEGKVSRKELFITTKLPPIGNHPDRVKHFFELSLKALDTDYIDLYLMHFPIGFHYVNDDELFPVDSEGKHLIDMSTDIIGIWKEMEKLVDSGKVKSIGLSNFATNQVERIVKSSRILPTVIQVELNAYIQQKELREYCANQGIITVAYAPLGSPNRFRTNLNDFCRLIEDPIVNEIATKHNKKTSQVLLKYLVQIGVSAIPKSTNPERMLANIQIFDFQLDESDLQLMASLDRNERSFKLLNYAGIDQHPEYPYH